MMNRATRTGSPCALPAPAAAHAWHWWWDDNSAAARDHRWGTGPSKSPNVSRKARRSRRAFSFHRCLGSSALSPQPEYLLSEAAANVLEAPLNRLDTGASLAEA